MLKPNQTFTPNAEQKKLNNVRQQLGKRPLAASSRRKSNLCMKCTAPFVSTFLSCLSGCERWMIVVKKPRLMSWQLTWPHAWRCSCSNRVPATNTTNIVRTYGSRRIGIGPHLMLPTPNPTLLPTVNIAPPKGWPAGVTPWPAAVLAVSAFATGLNTGKDF